MRGQGFGVVLVFLSILAPNPALAQVRQTGDAAVGTRADAYRLFMLGRSLARDGDVDGAVQAYRDSADRDVASGEMLAELAELYRTRDRFDEAIRTANQALQREPDNTTAHRALGLIYAARLGQQNPSPQETAAAIEHLEQSRRTILPDLNVELTLARVYLTANQADDAIPLLEALIEEEVGFTEGGLLLSYAYERTSRVEEAVTMLEGVIASGRPSSRALRRLGELYGRVDRWSDAVKAYELAMARNPRSSGAQRKLANALLQDGKTERARDVLHELSTVTPDDVAVLYQLSEVERDLGNFDEASAAARRLIEVEPNGLFGPYALAEVYVRQYNYRDAIATLEAAVDTQDQNNVLRDESAPRRGRGRPIQIARMLGRIGFAYTQLQEYDPAIEAYTRAVDLVPTSSAYGARLVQAYLDAGRVADATAALKDLRPHHPDDLTVTRLEARILGDGGDVNGGVNVLRDALDRNDGDPAAPLALAAFYSNYDRLDNAVDVLESARVMFPDDLSILFQLGAVLERDDRHFDAERAFRSVLERDSDHAATLNYLGYMLADRGERLEESVDLLIRAIEIDPRNGAYLDSLGWAYLKLDRLELAETNLRQASEQMVWNSVIQDHFGDLLSKLGRHDEAIAAWEAALVGNREEIDVSNIEGKIQESRQHLDR
jgi:tetratricopeptide (TPR) repeat protein